MSNLPFNRTAINVRERPLSSDINRAQSELDRTLRDLLMSIYLTRGGISPDNSGLPLTGMIGDGLKVRPVSPASMSIQVNPGLGFAYDVSHSDLSIGGVNELNDLPYWKPLVLNSPAPTIAIDAAPGGGNSRYDIVEIRTNRLLGESTSRDVLNVISGAFEAQVINKSLDWSLEGSVGKVTDPAASTAAISLKAGIAAVSPTPPAVTPGYTKIAQILVGSGVTSVDADKIQDHRRLLFPYGNFNVSARVTFPAAPYNSLTMAALHAPPGVLVSALWLSNTPAWKLYVFPGVSPVPMLPVVTASGNVASATPIRVLAAVQQITVDSSLQAALAGASASPAINVAVGQTGWVFPFSDGGDGASAITFNVSAHLQG